MVLEVVVVRRYVALCYLALLSLLTLLFFAALRRRVTSVLLPFLLALILQKDLSHLLLPSSCHLYPFLPSTLVVSISCSLPIAPAKPISRYFANRRRRVRYFLREESHLAAWQARSCEAERSTKQAGEKRC
jgi:hypothetical protein